MGSSPNPYCTCMFLLSRTSWLLIPCSTHSPFALQTSGIPNHVVCATNSGYTKPGACILAPGPLHVPNQVHTLDQSTLTSFHKRTPRHLIRLNHAILYIAKFSLYSFFLQLHQQHHTIQNLLIGILHSMVGYHFHFITWFPILFTFLPPLPHPFSIPRLPQIHACHHPWPSWQILSEPAPTFPQTFTWFRLHQTSKDNVPG